jgi:hypothetical protein
MKFKIGLIQVCLMMAMSLLASGVSASDFNLAVELKLRELHPDIRKIRLACQVILGTLPNIKHVANKIIFITVPSSGNVVRTETVRFDVYPQHASIKLEEKVVVGHCRVTFMNSSGKECHADLRSFCKPESWPQLGAPYNMRNIRARLTPRPQK